MDDPNTTTTGTLEADEDILTYTASDEAIEAAAGIDRGRLLLLRAGDAIHDWREGLAEETHG
jgi:hypothetical protein